MAIMPQLDLTSFLAQSCCFTGLLIIFFISIFYYIPNRNTIHTLFLIDYLSKIIFLKKEKKL